MGLKEATSGFYGDLPYCSPVESSVFFDAVAASRMHRISESMISRADSMSYFMKENTLFNDLFLELRKGFDENASKLKRGGVLEFLDIIPSLLHSSSAHRLVRESEEGKCFVVIESKEASDICGVFDVAKQDDSSVYVVVSLDVKGMDYMWQSLLTFLLGGASTEKNMVYVLPIIDVYLQKGNAYGEFLFSLWATGVSSILHHFALIAIDSVRERLNKVSIRIGALKGHEGDSILDDVQLFFEDKLRICVYRVLNNEVLPNDPFAVETECAITAGDREEWLEKATELILGVHEELCDTSEEKTKKDDAKLRCVLFIIPDIISLQNDLKRQLSDSYTSTPIIVVTRENQIYELLSLHNRSAPIVFFCSQKNLQDQLLKPEHERYLNRLCVEAFLYGERNRYVWEIALIRMLFPGSQPFYLLPYPLFDSTNSDERNGKANELEESSLEEAINIILWLFRRFKLETCPKGIQPVLRVSEMFFISRGAALIFEKVMNAMKSSGLVSSLSTSDESYSFRLEVLGRAVSYRFCLPYESKFPEFTSFDVKCIFWCHALRQSKETALKLISSAHNFPTWIEAAIDNFCLKHRIKLENGTVTEREALVKGLSLIPNFDGISSRINAFLTHPSGKRIPILGNFVSASSTCSRGWFEQAPVSKSAESVTRPHVNVYCYPSHNEICEICFGDHTIQCPLDLSYPLIVTHIVLHTTLWNNAIILESGHDNGLAAPLPIPLALLHSPTLNSILEDVDDGKVGFWLDNCMDSTPPLSDPLELASLMAKTPSLVGLCDHEALRRKRTQVDWVMKRQKCEVKEVSAPLSEAEAATIREFANAAIKLGRENAEKRFKGMRGFAFLNSSHENHAYYLHVLGQSKP
ncbi:hypothetical protein MOQ_002777 [Trypanosoma cruzi marinkellei]|uniref:Uncharacterized protein n=1 Tax=Trypanosoma cruzi marinkellei TaxID=85056 RepID=K2N5V1_TRYCR|nr:hypothetical protein MOQ_002777 [Trypanosoma cruzi marinkellei]